MSLQTSNTSADIYRNANSPPAAPDVAGVPIMLTADFASSHLANVGTGAFWRWTHVAMIDLTVDVRDPYQGGTSPSSENSGMGWQDSFYIPDQNGTQFRVVYVERVGYGTAIDFKRVYLQRATPSWPTSNL